jgi:acyl-CoA thioesterase-1
MHRALPALLLALSPACGEPEPEPVSPTLLDAPAADVTAAPRAELEVPADAPRVAFVGDSIGAGLHLAAHQAWPRVVQRRLADEGLAFELIDSSESGRTTSGGVTALAWVLRSEPDLVVISLGGNDGLRGIPIETVEANLRAMIERAREAQVRVLLLGIRLPPNYEGYAGEFDALYPRLAEEYGLAFVPFYMDGVGGVPELNLEDGLHPTAEGQERLADNVIGELRRLVTELGDA